MSRFVPEKAQIEATEPGSSNWVGANAGSGKTHVLTQRVARLLLAGAAPQKILCLTYTKAAAAEMQTRLFQTLGTWAMEPAAELAQRLADLSGESDAAMDPARLADARRLFARALETPGGLKIQTIHAFCDSLLRRFPLEAGVSPRFEVADDRQSRQILADIREDMALAAEAGEDPAYDRAVRLLTEGGVEQLTDAILGRRAPYRTGDIEDCLAAHFGHAAKADEREICREALGRLDWDTYRALAGVLTEQGGSHDRPVGGALSLESAARDQDPAGAVAKLMGSVLTSKMEARSASRFPVKAVKQARPSAEAELQALTDWALETRDRINAARLARKTRDLYTFATSLMTRLERAKEARGLLDFDDLVSRAEALLTNRAMRAWVLYKLDQGIDHILVDEAQDTSPQQWAVIAAIAEEFLSGEGARSEARSLFVVGDDKQSIYSFQGAEPQAFGDMRAHFKERLAAMGTPLGEPGLRMSYRSAPAILDFVDRVFEGPAAEGLTVGDAPILHKAHRAHDQGRVDLWPLVTPEPAPEKPHWSLPVDTVSPADTKERLAATVAQHIAHLVGQARLPARDGREGRLVAPEDILVLVRQRDRLAQGIIRGLKGHGVPVAGADRLSLAAELAVKDLLALVRVALLPSDDLTLAALLRSPLCGVSEEDLFTLAHGREGTLWQAVQTSERHTDVAGFLKNMAAQADYLRPYEFLEHALITHDGRRRLLGRLGAEAEDPIDELLAQALSYEARETPSLAGFVQWVDAADIEVKREMDRGMGQVRVMTIHGAKGLEAPVVILPDNLSTVGGGAGRPQLLPTVSAPELTLWVGTKAEDDPVGHAARARAEAREEAERKRLLYVALTRAEDWLILCGALPGNRKSPEGTWYQMLQDGIARCEGVTELPSPTGEGAMLRYQTGAAATEPAAAPERPALASPIQVEWLTPVAEEKLPERGAPSTANDASGAHGGIGRGRALAMRRGSAVHFLLEHDPDIRPQLLCRSFPDLPPGVLQDVRDEAAAVRAMPEAAWIFAPDTLAEVSVAIDPPHAGPRMIGRIDRLVRRNNTLFIVDFKTDPVPPERAEDVAKPYLAQLGAYAAGLGPAWPGQEIRLVMLWTATPRLMEIPLDRAREAFLTTVFARNADA